MHLQTQTYIFLLTVVLGTNSAPSQANPININIYNGDCTKENDPVPSCECAKDEWFTIQSTSGGDLVVDATEPKEFKLQRFTGSETQLWKFERANRPGTYYIINKKTRGTLDIDTHEHPFRPIIADKKNGSSSQQWATNFNGRLRNVGVNKNLDVAAAKFEPGTKIILWEENGNKAQEFVLHQK